MSISLKRMRAKFSWQNATLPALANQTDKKIQPKLATEATKHITTKLNRV